MLQKIAATTAGGMNDFRPPDMVRRKSLIVGRATTKTDAGECIIPLNADAVAAIVELYRRALMCSGTEANHYVFPACENGRIDPTRSQTSFKEAKPPQSSRKLSVSPRMA
jgi:hypothetical protein